MISSNTQKIVLFLLKNPHPTGYNINQLAKRTTISVGSAFSILKTLENKQLIKKMVLSNASYYSLRLDNKETIALCELALHAERREQQGSANIAINDLQEEQHAHIIMLFGSVMNKKNPQDVDALFITNHTKETLDFCTELSTIRTTPYNPLILRKEDFIKEITAHTEAIISIVKQGVVVRGEKEFIEVMRDVKLQR